MYIFGHLDYELRKYGEILLILWPLFFYTIYFVNGYNHDFQHITMTDEIL